MSNVLIGIIGVILFIGLALAGALFLGPRFQESSNNAKASAIIQSIAQTANAANMYRVQEGSDIDNDVVGIETLVSKGYLKVAPPVTSPVTRIITLNANGSAIGAPDFVIAEIRGATARSICDSIEQQSGGTPDPTNTPIGWNDKVKRQQGCYFNSGVHLAYVRI